MCIKLDSLISVGGKSNVKLIKMGDTNFLFKVELMWTEDPSLPLSLRGYFD